VVNDLLRGKSVNRAKVLISIILVLVAGLTTTGYVLANPSSGFRETNGEAFDDWDICRTRGTGKDGFYQMSRTGFRPVIAFESLGENSALAYELGEQMAQKYPDQTQRAEAVFYFVRDRVRYAPDKDLFEYDEFAQNADELATTIDEDGIGYGDCEDTAVLLAVLYKGAGYRSAIALVPGHTAALVYLPGYEKTPTVLEIDGEPGWLWAEATGNKNPLGWVPKEFINAELAAYEISAEAIAPLKPPEAPSTAVTKTGQGGTSLPFPFMGIIGLLWLISLFRRKR